MRLRRLLFGNLFFLMTGAFVFSIPAQESRGNALTNRHCLWKAEGKGSTVYLLGSIHMLTESDYPLAQPIEAAFSNSAIAVFETDISQMERPDVQFKMASKAQLPAGETLDQQVSARTYAAFSNHVVKAGLPVEMFNQFKPS